MSQLIGRIFQTNKTSADGRSQGASARSREAVLALLADRAWAA
ncbi:hypothetical protein WKR88_03960 [Trinickia caryophylli]|uniref:Uncharacterized protein n=1 Tax=Trinickia caryophylli TaxID=28094 RepID=A0A1X7CCG7_TRICW|nr:hypothetical protein [Trinickia caryophylli]WQE12975.1 hypothetical protein U0034_06150 [Trinickia caryophylli]SME94134.1 hypothetical protein SAMN06295900_101175 [Trinickia caryophylli]